MAKSIQAGELRKRRVHKLVDFDVAGALRDVLNTGRKRYERAVSFYEFYIALLHCEGLSKTDGPEGPAFKIEVRKRCLRHARTHALAQLAATRSVRDEGSGLQCLAQMVEQNNLRSLGRAPDFLAPPGQRQRREDFLSIAPLVEFSLRLRDEDLKRRTFGGVTKAREILAATKGDPGLLGVRVGKSTLEKNWRRFEPVAIFSYLFSKRLRKSSSATHELPKFLTSGSFGDHLLEIIDDRQRLRLLVARYGHVHARLQRRNYVGLPSLPPLLEEPMPDPELTFCELPKRVLRYAL